MWIALIVVLAIIVILVIFYVATYNGLVGLRNQMKNAWHKSTSNSSDGVT